MNKIPVINTEITVVGTKNSGPVCAALTIDFYTQEKCLTLNNVAIRKVGSNYHIVFPTVKNHSGLPAKLELETNVYLHHRIFKAYERHLDNRDSGGEAWEDFYNWTNSERQGKFSYSPFTTPGPIALSFLDAEMMQSMKVAEEQAVRRLSRMKTEDPVYFHWVGVEYLSVSDNGGRRANLKLTFLNLDGQETVTLRNVQIKTRRSAFRIEFPPYINQRGIQQPYDLETNKTLHQQIFADFDDYLNSHISEMHNTYSLFDVWAQNNRQGSFSYSRDVAPDAVLSITTTDYERLRSAAKQVNEKPGFDPRHLVNEVYKLDGHTMQIEKLYFGSQRVADLSCLMETPIGTLTLFPMVVRCVNDEFFVDLSKVGVTFLSADKQEQFENALLTAFEQFIERYRFDSDILKIFQKLRVWRGQTLSGDA